MKVLFLNSSDTIGGAARAAFRLHKGLRSINVDARMFVQKKESDEQSVEGPTPFLGNWIEEIKPHLDALPVCLYSRRNKMLFSPAILPTRINKQISSINPDIIHLNWICEGFVKIENLQEFKKPIVWTLHDSWAFTGGCHIPFDCTRYRDNCGACPVLGSSMAADISSWIWKRKHKSWSNLNLTVVAPSKWLARCAGSSSLFRNTRIEVIPNGLDTNSYRPEDPRLAREMLGLPCDKKLILFGAMKGDSDPNKGFQYLQKALRILSDRKGPSAIEAVVFGASQPENTPEVSMKIHYLGRLYDDVALRLAYSSADVMVVPSIQEAFGQTSTEAMSCGTPVVAFATSGLLDIVDHQVNGFLAKAFDAEDLARGISWVLDHIDSLGLARCAREKVKNYYSIDKVSDIYKTLYNDLSSRVRS